MGRSAPRSARRFVASSLAGLAGDVVATAQLLVSELVTNSVTHTRTREPVCVEVDVDDDRVRIEVLDAGPGGVRLVGPGVGVRDHGFGLRLVDALARDWGARRVEHQTQVWFELAL